MKTGIVGLYCPDIREPTGYPFIFLSRVRTRGAKVGWLFVAHIMIYKPETAMN